MWWPWDLRKQLACRGIYNTNYNLNGSFRFNGFINVSKLCSPLSEVGSMVIDDIFHALNKCKHVELELCWSRLKTFLVLFHIRQKPVISSRHGSTFCVLSWFLLLYIWSASHTTFIRHPHPGEGNASDHTARPGSDPIIWRLCGAAGLGWAAADTDMPHTDHHHNYVLTTPSSSLKTESYFWFLI